MVTRMGVSMATVVLLAPITTAHAAQVSFKNWESYLGAGVSAGYGDDTVYLQYEWWHPPQPPHILERGEYHAVLKNPPYSEARAAFEITANYLPQDIDAHMSAQYSSNPKGGWTTAGVGGLGVYRFRVDEDSVWWFSGFASSSYRGELYNPVFPDYNLFLEDGPPLPGCNGQGNNSTEASARYVFLSATSSYGLSLHAGLESRSSEYSFETASGEYEMGAQLRLAGIHRDVRNGGFSEGLDHWTKLGDGQAEIGGEAHNPYVVLVSGSPISISQHTKTPDIPFALYFEYMFQQPSGTITVLLGDNVIKSIDATSGIGTFNTELLTIDEPALFGLSDAELKFLFEAPQPGLAAALDNIAFYVVPEPNSLSLAVGALVGVLGVICFRKRTKHQKRSA